MGRRMGGGREGGMWQGRGRAVSEQVGKTEEGERVFLHCLCGQQVEAGSIMRRSHAWGGRA